jgi:hypothetical protein
MHHRKKLMSRVVLLATNARPKLTNPNVLSLYLSHTLTVHHAFFPQVYNNVFLFDVSDRTYSQLHPKGLLPPARRGHSAVLSYTSGSRHLVVFGGAGPSGVSKRDNYFNDVCVLNMEGRLWSKPTCSGKLSSRSVLNM